MRNTAIIGGILSEQFCLPFIRLMSGILEKGAWWNEESVEGGNGSFVPM